MDNKKNVEHWADQFMNEFSKESDRASIIVAATILDSALESIIKRLLVPVPSPHDNLLDNASNAPISDFSTRIDLAHRLGLISAQFCRDLHLLRKMRNDVAHNIERSSFDNPSIRSRAAEIVCSSGICKRMPDELKKVAPKGIRGEFQLTVSAMIWHLWSYADEVSSIKPANLEWLLYSSFEESAKKEGDPTK